MAMIQSGSGPDLLTVDPTALAARVKVYGKDNASVLAIDSTHSAARVSPRPVELGTGGAFRSVFATGALTGAGASTPVMSFRWTSATLNALLMRMQATIETTTAFTTAQFLEFAPYIARSFTANDSGGNAVTAPKKRTSLAATAVGDFRVASTGALTAGTRTLDAQPVGYLAAYSAAAGFTLGKNTLFDIAIEEQYPIVLAQNEGLVVNNVIALGAAGVLKIIFELEWLELPVANF